MKGRVVAGRYELLEQLGDSTWRATDTELGRDVVVRFGEVSGAALSHQGIARVFEQGEADGERFAVLEYLPGGTLAERGTLPPAAAAQLAAALAYAHDAGIAHGALDARSILFDAEGRAKLAGFRGEGDPAADLAALDALRAEYEPDEEATLIAAPPVPPTAPPPARGRPRRNVVVLAVALLLALAGIAAAFLAGSDDSPAEGPSTSLSVPVPTGSTDTDTEEDEPEPPPSTTEATTTEPTTSDTQPTVTTLPPPTTDGPLPTVPTVPPTLPPEPTEPPPTTEPPPPTTTEEPLPPTTTEG